MVKDASNVRSIKASDFKFEYDFNAEHGGLFILDKDGKDICYFSDVDLGHMFNALQAERIKEEIRSNQNMNWFISELAQFEVCKACNGGGTIKNGKPLEFDDQEQPRS